MNEKSRVFFVSLLMYAIALLAAGFILASSATVTFEDAGVLEVENQVGRTVITVEAQGAVQIFYCDSVGTLGRICAELLAGDTATLSGQQLPADGDLQGVELLSLTLRPDPPVLGPPPEPTDQDGR